MLSLLENPQANQTLIRHRSTLEHWSKPPPVCAARSALNVVSTGGFGMVLGSMCSISMCVLELKLRPRCEVAAMSCIKMSR